MKVKEAFPLLYVLSADSAAEKLRRVNEVIYGVTRMADDTPEVVGPKDAPRRARRGRR